MFHYSGREDKVFIFTLDHVLAADVRRRIADDPRMEFLKVLVPNDGEPGITVPHVHELLRETTSARVIILDVRSLTLPRLQEQYNRIAGYNRADLNERVFTLCIGDSPSHLLAEGANLDMLARMLAQMRQDYNPVMYYYDPFLDFHSSEMVGFGVDQRRDTPSNIPERYARAFAEESVSQAAISKYFRAEGASEEDKPAVKRRRQKKLHKMLRKQFIKDWPDEKHRIAQLFTPKGLTLPDETLAVGVYPMYFDERVYHLLEKSRS